MSNQLWIGILFIILGLVITVASHAMAGPGGSYVITTGLFVVGVIKIIKGLLGRD